MKKVLFIIMIIAMAIGVGQITRAVYAMFTANAKVESVSFSTGNAELLLQTEDNYLFENMSPGYTNFQNFSLKNTSTSDIKMTLSAKLGADKTESTSGSWTALKEKILVRISTGVGETLTTWNSLDALNSSAINFDFGLNKDETRNYKFEVMVDSKADNEISGKGLSGLTFNFTGTQE